MLRARTLLMALSIASAVVAPLPRILAADASADFTSRLDVALAKLAKYDFGGDSSVLAAVGDLTRTSYGNPAERQLLASRLADVLKSPAPRGAKDLACRQLSIIGTASEVPALAELLGDEQLSHPSRLALERIPSPAASESLRMALSKVKGRLLVGVINSLGNRRCEAALADLAGLLNDPDPSVTQAAAAALGKIGPAAAPALRQALDRAGPKTKPAVAEAYLLCADRLVAQGKPAEAIAIYDALRKSSVKPVQIAATRGEVLARGAAGAPLLVELLGSSDARLSDLGLVLARETPGTEITIAVCGAQANLPSRKRIFLIQALALRGDRVATSIVMDIAARDADAKVRLAAIQALARLGNVKVASRLATIASKESGELAQAALASLVAIPDKEVDAMLRILLKDVSMKLDRQNATFDSHIESSDLKLQRVAIDALAQRHVAEAASDLLRLVESGPHDDSNYLAAIQALGDTVAAKDLDMLVSVLTRFESPRHSAATEAALSTACSRMIDRETCAAVLAAGIWKADARAKSALLRTLGRIGGARAIDAVRSALKTEKGDVRETAIRILVEWSDPAAIGDLAALAKSADSPTHKILALRGYARLIGLSSQPVAQKLAMCKEAMSLADRNDEKRVVLGALRNVPTVEAITVVTPFLDTPELTDEAAAAILGIGDKIAQQHPAEVAAAMNKVLAVTKTPNLVEHARAILTRVQKPASR